MATRTSGGSTDSPAFRWVETGTAASVASGASPMACAIRSSAADEGGQLTATLKHESDAGQLTLYARYLDDKNQFITPIPVIQRGTDNFSAYPGFDPLTATYNSEAIRRVRLDGYPNGGTTADLAEGRGAQMLFVGAELRPRVRPTAGRSATGCSRTTATSTPTRCSPAAIPPRCSTSCTPFPPISAASRCRRDRRRPRSWAVARSRPTRASSTRAGGSSTRNCTSINNDFRLSKELSEGNTLTVGLYLAYYEMDDEWALGNQMFMTNEPNARPITVSYVSGGQTFLRTDEQGFLDNGGVQHHAARPRLQQRDLSIRFLARQQVAAGRIRALREPGRHQQRLQPAPTPISMAIR